MDSKHMDTKVMDIKATWHPHGLGKFQGIPNGNDVRPMINGIPIWEESHKMYIH